MNAQRFNIPISGWPTAKAGSQSSKSSFGPDDFECEVKIRRPQTSPDHEPLVRFPAPRWAGNLRITAGIVLAAFLSLCSVGRADRTITGTSGSDTICFGVVIEGGTRKLGIVTINTAGTSSATYSLDEGRLAIYGGDGNDRIEAINNADREGLMFLNSEDLTFTQICLYGGSGNDELRGTPRADHLYGEDGNDLLVGNQGDDYLSGGDGNDFLSGGQGEDILHGGNDNDYLLGDQGDDYLFGEPGDDILVGGTGDDYLDGGTGDDEFWCRTVPGDNPNAIWDDSSADPASSDCGDTTAPVNIEHQKQGNPYEDWVRMANYGHGRTTFHHTTSNPNLLLADRAAGAVVLLTDGGDVPVTGDFDRDGCCDDLALFRPTLGKWAFDHNHDCHTDTLTTWGQPGDIPVAGDFDGDGHLDDVAVFRPGNRMWYFDYHHDGTTDKTSGPWGAPGDIPIAGSFDTDRKCDDVGVFRPGTGMWYYDYDANGTTDQSRGPWGEIGDIPVVGDFFYSTQKDDVAVFRRSTGKWYYDFHHDGTTDFESRAAWGEYGDIPFAGDLDADGRCDDVGVFRPSNRMWYLDYNLTASTDETFGPWGDAGSPLHATHKQYGNSCGPTSLNMVFEQLGRTDHGLRRWFPRDLDTASRSPVPSTAWPNTAVDVGYHLSMEHIMWEGFHHNRQTERDWTPSASFMAADGRLNTSNAGQVGSFYGIRYDLGNVDWNSTTRQATGPVQMWLQSCPGPRLERKGSGVRAGVCGQPVQRRTLRCPAGQPHLGPGRKFQEPGASPGRDRGLHQSWHPARRGRRKWRTLQYHHGVLARRQHLLRLYGGALDGWGRPFYCKPMRWRRVLLTEEMLRNGSCTFVAILLGHAASPGGGRRLGAQTGRGV